MNRRDDPGSSTRADPGAQEGSLTGRTGQPSVVEHRGYPGTARDSGPYRMVEQTGPYPTVEPYRGADDTGYIEVGYVPSGRADRAVSAVTAPQRQLPGPDRGGWEGRSPARADGYRPDGPGAGFLADWERHSGDEQTDVWGKPRPGPGAGIAIQARSRREYVNETGEGRIEGGARLLIMILFWATLICSVELWWLQTPPVNVHSTGSLLVAAGRITGMIAGFVLLVQILMMSRVAWLEHWVGAHDLLLWHRELGAFLVIVVLAHTVLLILGYAGSAHASPWQETWTMATTLPDMISAFVATGILVAVGVLAIRGIRRRMPYEMWYYLHLASYLVLLLAYGHQFADGEELVTGGFAKWYWLVLYAFTLSCLVWGRMVEPLWLNLRHRFRVLNVVPEGPGMISVYIGGHHLQRLDARAGQYFRWRFLTPGSWWQAHPFSLSAAPNPQWLRLTVKVVGDHTNDLQFFEPGVRVFAEGPSGVFTADRRVRGSALLIAGGSGIAPIRSLMESLPAGTVVLYRASRAEDIVFRAELDWMAAERGMRIWYVLGSRDEPWPRYVFTPRGMRELVPDVNSRDIYMCGPDGIISASLKTLRRLGVPQRQIHLDPFEF